MLNAILDNVPIWLCLIVSLLLSLWGAKGLFEEALDGNAGWQTWKKWVKGLVGFGTLVVSLWTGCVYGFRNTLSSVRSDPARAVLDAPDPPDDPLRGPLQRDEESARRLADVLHIDKVEGVKFITCEKVLGERAAIIAVESGWSSMSRDARLRMISHAQARWQQVTRSPFEANAPVYMDTGEMGLVLGGSHRGAGLAPWLLEDADAPRLMHGINNIHMLTDDDRRLLRKRGKDGFAD
jgi:hypothetical protein